MSHPNALTWFEIPVTNIDTAQHFYETVLALKLERQNFPMGGEQYVLAVFPAEGEGVKGCLQTGGATGKASAEGTVVYLDCGPSLDAALARAQSLHATVVLPRTALPPGMGFIALLLDPDGNRVGLHAVA